jgi:hypothetical protein
VRFFSGGWRGKGKEGSSAGQAGTLGRPGGDLPLKIRPRPGSPCRNERVPLQLGVLGVGGDRAQPEKVLIDRSNQIHATNRPLNSLRSRPCAGVPGWLA